MEQTQTEELLRTEERRDSERELERELISLFQMTSRLEYELELAVNRDD